MKKFLLIRIGFLLILVLLFFLGRNYFQSLPRFSPSKETYSHRIGYIDPDNAILLDSLEKYAAQSLSGYYHNSAPDIYNGSKYEFKNYIHQNYKNRKYTDNGYVNLRFYLNEKGSVFMYEVNELNLDLELSDINDDLVNQLISLSFRDKNWTAIFFK